jgi:threonyl-tRNA synthetase
MVDLTRPIEQDARLEILTPKDPAALQVYRHSTAHLLAAAVLELYPETKLGIGPPTDIGFFYDFQRETPFTPDDLEKIEKKMAEIQARNLPYERVMTPKEEGLRKYADQKMKIELITEKADSVFSEYTLGPNFIDFCRGPHVPSTSKIKAFKLLSVAGAYWKGDEKGQRLQRIYGTAFFTKKELDEYLQRLEEAKKRDHRKLGRELDLFSIQELAGPGLIFFHPKGGAVRKLLEDWMRAEYLARGYSLVYTPHVARRELYKVSGHANFYSDNMFTPMELDDAEYQLKPMNCPGHILIYNKGLRSYRELPLRYGEFGVCTRNEPSGALHGIMRIRAFTQDDGHIFCTEEQIEPEVTAFTALLQKVYADFGFTEVVYKLATRPPKRVGADELWDKAERALRASLDSSGLVYDVLPGEGAFYGPKIEYHLRDSIGRSWQCGTMQVDFSMPGLLGAEYVAEDNTRKVPVMLHRAIVGSMERFIGILIEHYAGAMPLWLAPVQVMVLNISEGQTDYATRVAAALKQAGYRCEADLRNEKITYKIREHSLQKLPYQLIVGEKEKAAEKVAVRTRSGEDLGQMSLPDFIARLRNEAKAGSTA